MKVTTVVAALALPLALGCSRKGAGAPSRAPVAVARAEQRPVPYEISATGTAEPRRTASVQSQVSGILTHVAFREGDEVAPGQLLFQVDPRPFQATLEQAKAMLARDQAQAQSAVADAERYAELVKQDYVTKSDYDAKRAAAEALQAAVRADSAAVASAQLNLEWAAIRAPIAGRTGRLLVREGNLVRANAADALVVPAQAVMTGQQGTYVFVLNQDGTARSQPVTVERPAGAYTVIAQGVRPGDEVVTDGQVRLVNGAPVEVKGSADPARAMEGDK